MHSSDGYDPADLTDLCSRLRFCCGPLQIAGGRSLQALLSAKVALLSAIAGSIAVGSCVLNDFFDYSVDIINEPNKVTLMLQIPQLCPIMCKLTTARLTIHLCP